MSVFLEVPEEAWSLANALAFAFRGQLHSTGSRSSSSHSLLSGSNDSTIQVNLPATSDKVARHGAELGGRRRAHRDPDVFARVTDLNAECVTVMTADGDLGRVDDLAVSWGRRF